MKKQILNYLCDKTYNWKLYGKGNYYQLCIEPGQDVCINSFYNLGIDAEIIVSCVHNDDLGMCLMIEFYK